MIGLTKRQQETVAFIRTFRDSNGVMPSYSDIASGLGTSSRGNIKRVMDVLVERGAIRRLSNRSRAIELVEPDAAQKVTLSGEVYRLLSAYASGMHISIDTAASELLRQALGAS